MARAHPDAVYVSFDSLLYSHRTRILQFLDKHRLPAMTGAPSFPAGGALMSYGPDFVANYRRAATYVDRLLKGAKAAELAVEQPEKFILVINLKTARALGMTLPPSLLLRADQVIE
jgi:putative ABC transport system substrate-binding protein